MRILVTNDDGIDSVGLHVLVRAMCDLRGDHEIVVVAPDTEYSGAGAALGALFQIQPEIVRASIPDCDAEAWTVNGPPGLCVMFSRLGAFGGPFDLIVSGINPGANVGRAVYHSGTIGACLTGRNGHVSGIAVSQAVSGWGVEGQAWSDLILNQQWESAAECAKVMAQSLVDDMPSETVIVNLNVPDLPIDEIKGWRHAEIGLQPPRSVATAELEPIEGRVGAFKVTMQWGEKLDLPSETDAGTVEEGFVSVSYLSRIEHEDRPDVAHADKALAALLD
ncbi:5'/3'-nucleotidase SurE [Ilumatobacter coccineus]|uniref:5'-nucleotidase n=1 Tax=Ilumatobacter coccineus (strain NBRC 103263 / KCTC 29153 / YM16-304) TaxID=1313172 RepID=A0A6C7E8P8_ILUCY|nr:5'/3'-nucleotidase SurE [Ilumatobacter coccineus]BAN01525.1 5'-nucleotidase SurE [Ilumatobacter coccineus YM16-304]